MTKPAFLLLFLAVGFMLAALMIPNMAQAQKKPGAMKIGIYDSRSVVFAWSRSDFFKEHMKRFAQQSDSAQKANDTTRIKELSVQAMSYQHLLHQMVFGAGSAAEITALIKDKLPDLAGKTGVSMIVSKFEVTWLDPSVETVDITGEVAKLFEPKENIDQMLVEIGKEEPVPLEDLTIETEMLDLYCKRFGK